MATADLLDHTSMGHGGKGKDACASSPDDGIGYSSSGAGPSGPHVENSPSPPDCPPGRHASSSSPTSTCAEPGPAGWGPSGGVKMERTSHVDSLSGCESVGSSGDAVAVAKFKHKLVEQSRREKTRALTSELQAMVPALADFNKGTNINVVLEGVLQYLRDSSSKDQSKGGRGEARERVQEQVTSLIRNKVKSVPWGISQKAFAFSPVGMVCSSTSGQLLWFNQSFGRMFSQVLTPEEVTRPSMFSLTAPESLPETMQAATSMLLGQRDRVAMSKRCVQREGNVNDFHVEMTCVRKNGAPAYFCCYVKPASALRHIPPTEDMQLCGLENHPATNVAKLQEILEDSDIPDELDGLFNFEED